MQSLHQPLKSPKKIQISNSWAALGVFYDTFRENCYYETEPYLPFLNPILGTSF